MPRVYVLMNRPAVDHLRGWNGDVGHAFSILAQQTKGFQIVGTPHKTGRLAASISVGPRLHWAGGIEVAVGAGAGGHDGGGGFTSPRGVGYALYTDQGTAPHTFGPRDPNGYLVFFWVKVGHWVRLKSVNHPGNRAHQWAFRGLKRAMRTWT